MTPTQQHLFKLLLEIDEICKRHDIDYFLGFGTILGAVRHEGFIPWDNDLDVLMTEENYEKFKEACIEDLDGQTRLFVDNRMNREFPMIAGHYTDLETCRMSSRTIFWDNYPGEYIDVFELIELPGEPEKMLDAANRYFAYDEICNRSFTHNQGTVPDITAYREAFAKRQDEIGREAALAEMEAKIFGHHYDDCSVYLVDTARLANFISFAPKHAFDTFKEVPFEGHMFKIPGDYVEVMTPNYGDTFNLFPTNPGAHTEMSHTGLPCKAYVNDYMPFLDKDELLGALGTFKDAGQQNAVYKGLDNRAFYKAQGLLVKRNIESTIAQNNLDVIALSKSSDPNDLAILDDLFAEYFDKQLARDVRYFRVHFDIGDDLEAAAWRVLAFYRGNMFGVDRIAALRWFNHEPLTDEMHEVRDVVQMLRGARKYLLYGDVQKAKTCLDELEGILPYLERYKMYRLRYNLLVADSNEQYESVFSQANQLLSEYPDNEQIRKTKADALLGLGKIDEAFDIYTNLEQDSRDGFILLDIKKKRESYQRPAAVKGDEE